MADQWKLHLQSLEQLRKMIFLLKGGDSVRPFASGGKPFFGQERSLVENWGHFFVDISRRIGNQSGELFFTIWKEEIKRLGKRVPLSEKGQKPAFGLWGTFGVSGSGNAGADDSFVFGTAWNLEIDYLREYQREKSRLYTSLGVMGGLFLAIVMS